MEVSGELRASATLPLVRSLGNHCIDRRVGPKVSLHALDKISISCSYRQSNHDSSGCPASSIVTILTELFCPVVCNAQQYFSVRRNVNAWRYIPFSITGRGVVDAFSLLRCYTAYVGSSRHFGCAFFLKMGRTRLSPSTDQR